MLPVDEIRLNFNPASLVVLNIVLGFLMFGIALDTRVADFKRVLDKYRKALKEKPKAAPAAGACVTRAPRGRGRGRP